MWRINPTTVSVVRTVHGLHSAAPWVPVNWTGFILSIPEDFAHSNCYLNILSATCSVFKQIHILDHITSDLLNAMFTDSSGVWKYVIFATLKKTAK